MTQKRLNGFEIHSSLQKVSGKTMSERVNAVTFLDAGLQLGKIVDALGVVDRNRSALSVGKKISRRAMLFPVAAKLRKQTWGQNRVAVFFPLALLHSHHHPFTVDGAYFKSDQFTHP